MTKRPVLTAACFAVTAMVCPAARAQGVTPGGDAPTPSPSAAPIAPPPTAPAGDEVAVDDEVEEVKEENPARPAPRGKGAVWGVVTSKTNGDTLVEAQVTVVGRKTRAMTDVDGRYRLELPPGRYEVRVYFELHKAQRIRNLRVEAGKVQRFDVALVKDETAEEEMSAVEVDAERGSTATQLLIRRNAVAASDGIGAQEIARTPDRNAAEAAKRVVGATIVESRYVYVRGLGERYTNALLNGAPLPSPEPDRQAVPLDVFPSVLLSDLSIQKTFTPDMPGDFAGGSVVIHTRDFPQKFQIQGTVSAGLNSETTFTAMPGHPNPGKMDWLGFDDNTRALPEGIPAEKLVDANPRTRERIDLTPYARALNSPMHLGKTNALPNLGGNVVAGGSVLWGSSNQHAFGYQGAVSYGRNFQRRKNEILRTYTAAAEPGGAPRMMNDYRGQSGVERAQWSTFGSVSYGYKSDHRITVSTIYTRTGEVEARQFVGYNEERDSVAEDTRMRFLTRGLFFAQLRGEHKIPAFNKAQITWTGTYAHAGLQDPDLRNTVYTFDPQTGTRVYEDNPLSGLHFYADQSERTTVMNGDWNQPIVEGKKPISLKFGALVSRRAREFNARRFVFGRNRNIADPSFYQVPPEQLFTDENVGLVRRDESGRELGPVLNLTEQTTATDAFYADYNVTSGYLMSDVALVEKVRFVGGGRVEAAEQTVESFDQFSPTLALRTARLAKTDFLPSANIIWKVMEDANVRLSLSRTVARPQLRELSPFLFTDYFGGRDIQGYERLNRTRITNADARFEWFPSATEVMAVSLFYKKFADPIEPVIFATGGRGLLSYRNQQSAENLGAELEIRKSLGFLAPTVPVLRDLLAVFNVTYVKSSVAISTRESGLVLTSAERPLAGQSPYVINAALDYQNDKSGTRLRVLYNVFGPRISQVGAFNLPDVYELPRHLVDFTAAQRLGDHVDLRMTVENIFNAPYRFVHGTGSDAALVNRYQLGTNFMLLATISN